MDYLKLRLAALPRCHETLQLAVVDLLYTHAASVGSQTGLSTLFELAAAPSKAVAFAAANAVLGLGETRAAVECAARVYAGLLTRESDNNARLVLINALTSLATSAKCDYVFRDVALDLLLVLNVGSSGAIVDLEVARRLIALVTNILPAEHCPSAVGFIRKELERVQRQWASVADASRAGANRDLIEYHRLLVDFVRALLERHSGIQNRVLPVLVGNVATAHSTVALDILELVRNIVVAYPHSKEFVLHELSNTLTSLGDVSIFRSALWVMIECASSREHVSSVVGLLDGMIVKDVSGLDTRPTDIVQKGNVVVSSDGSYVTLPAQTTSLRSNTALINKFIQEGNTHVCSAIATSVIKLSVLASSLFAEDQKQLNVRIFLIGFNGAINGSSCENRSLLPG